MAGTAQAQLEFFEKSSDLAALSDADLDTIYNEVQAGKISQVTITCSVIPSLDSAPLAAFGIDIMSDVPVPVIAKVMVDTTSSGPKVTEAGNVG